MANCHMRVPVLCLGNATCAETEKPQVRIPKRVNFERENFRGGLPENFRGRVDALVRLTGAAYTGWCMTPHAPTH